MKFVLSALCLIFTMGCSPNNTIWVIKGKDALPMMIDTQDVKCGDVDGKWIRFYTDKNENGEMDDNEVLSSFTVCNGTGPGISVVPSTTCANGGFEFVVNGLKFDVCNGETGPQGPMGDAGLDADLRPVLLCPGDKAEYPEFGLKIAGKLYAVYYDAERSLSFLALLTPGNYVTTNGSNCEFQVNEDGETKRL